MTDVQSLWRGLISYPQSPVSTPAGIVSSIIEAVSSRHGVTASDITGDRRTAIIAHARQEVMWQLRQLRRVDGTHRYSTPRVGRILGGRDHATVLFGVKAHERRVAESLGPDNSSQCLGHSEGGILIP